MTNNDILKNLRYTLDYNDAKMVSIFAFADLKVSRSLISQIFRKEEEPDFRVCKGIELATFLNGLIVQKRGKKEGPSPEPEKKMTNNIVLRKLKIAFNLKNNDILDILKLADFDLSNHELTAFFRKIDHKNFRKCKDQVLRNFLKGLQIKFRPGPSD